MEENTIVIKNGNVEKEFTKLFRQMSRQVSRGSAGEYQEDEQAGVARLRWRVSV